MMGDRDFRAIIQNSLDSIGRELQLDIDSENLQTIHLQIWTSLDVQNHEMNTTSEGLKYYCTS